MEEDESGIEDKKEARVTVDIRGEVLRQAIALRHRAEEVRGEVVSMSEIVRDAIREKYEREIGGKEGEER